MSHLINIWNETHAMQAKLLTSIQEAGAKDLHHYYVEELTNLNVDWNWQKCQKGITAYQLMFTLKIHQKHPMRDEFIDGLLMFAFRKIGLNFQRMGKYEHVVGSIIDNSSRESVSVRVEGEFRMEPKQETLILDWDTIEHITKYEYAIHEADDVPLEIEYEDGAKYNLLENHPDTRESTYAKR